MADPEKNELHERDVLKTITTPAMVAGKPWREWAWRYLGNCIVTAVLLLGYVLGLSTGLQGIALIAFGTAIISQAGFLNLIPGLLTAWPLICWRRRNSARLFAGITFALLQVGLLVDIVIFRLFQRHFDSLVWNVLTTKGAGDSVRVDPASAMMATVIIIVFVGCSLGFALWVAPRLVQRRSRFGLAIILIALLVERTCFAVIDLRDNSTMQTVRDTLPLYQPVTIKHLAKKFGYKRPPGEIRIISDSAKSLHLPRHPLGLKPNAREPNVLFIAVEGGRADALDGKTMPHLNDLADDSFRMTKHFSTGNETRFGIFGMLYGIPGTYWHRALSQSISPPWFDLLANYGYEFKILSCTDLNYPEFRQTVFLKLTNAITDQWNAPHVDRDRLMTDKFLNYLSARTNPPVAAHPFFSFLFFDASHQPYEHPLEDQLYKSSKSGEINYLKLALSSAGADGLKYSYLNSLHYVDRQIDRIVKDLKSSGEYDRTIIVVAGDHGEEFGELGHIGHCSAFNRFQTQTFAVLHLPGENPRVIDHVTSHVDFVPSVLTWMGITNSLDDYTTGESIEGIKTRDWALLAGWQDTALCNAGSITVFKPSQTLYMDMNGHKIPQEDLRRVSSTEVFEALQQIGLFFK
jgi:membrane-anchored protein YejM (alkaline phosphatase superfamily)